ncbi:MAG TPA: glycosyltransferase [Bryobacteraceae bacterium]|nr:glycosyltransferase [Bryobacteraceae bacterium]
MRVALFCQSIVSDWNHGNAHFLRGIARELLARGHEVRLFEPRDSWSLRNLIADHGEAPVARFHAAFPQLRSCRYDARSLDLDEALNGVSLVLVHEWNTPELVARIGAHRRRGGRYHLLFHDTHHRSVTDRAGMREYDLSGYDGVLAFGDIIRDFYEREGWARRAWTWHEAADVRVFYPVCETLPPGQPCDLIWIGNWGDEERSRELECFLINPVRSLGLTAKVYGVRYPAPAQEALARAGIFCGGWIPNYQAPAAFAGARITLHIPRRPYLESLPGIPTIRVFEALACGIPLVSARWRDAGGLFVPGRDFLVARDASEISRCLRKLLADSGLRAELARHGRETILARHTCAHRVNELLEIYECLNH